MDAYDPRGGRDTMEYTYEVTLDAPLGKKRGLLVLNAIAGTAGACCR